MKSPILALSLAMTTTATAQELITCSKFIGSSKTNCEGPKLIQEAALLSTFSVLYDYACRYNMTAHAPALSPGLEAGLVHYQFQIGQGNSLEVPETKQLVFRYLNDKQPMLHKDCSLKINRILQLPAASTMALWNQEAKRLTQLLQAKAEHYSHATDIHRWIENYSLTRLETIQTEIQGAFNQLVETALSSSDTDGPPGVEPQPRDYGLNLKEWSELDVEKLGIIARPDNTPFYVPVVDRSKPEHRWYFEAIDTLPVVANVMSQLALIRGARLMKEQAHHAGYVLPEKDQLRKQLDDLLAEAREFLNQIRDYREQLKDQVKGLEDQMEQTTVATTKN